MVVSTIKMTARQFAQLGADPPGVRLELVNGEIAVSPSPTPQHARVVSRLFRLLDDYVERNRLGIVLQDVDTELSEHEVRRPDLFYFTAERMHLVAKHKLLGVPDLVVEVISEGTGQIDREVKMIQYAAAGIPHYWIVDPESRSVEAYQIDRGAYRLIGAGKSHDVLRLQPFAELEIPLQSIWWKD